MKYCKSILDTIGNTPIVRLNSIGEDLGANLFAKLEFTNPGGSIKDRMVKYMLDAFEESGDLKPGGAIVENSSGNTGAALSMLSAVRGYDCTITIPDKMSSEKVRKMKAYGANVVVTRTDVPADSEESYYSTAARISRETGALYPDQYNNPINGIAHYNTTGPEIWEQSEGDIDVVICGIGTGGTISGVGRYLKERKPGIRVVGVDPIGSIFYDYFKTGKFDTPNTYLVEGIGEDYLVESVDFSVIDDMIQITDQEAFDQTLALAEREGILAGGSSGAALAGALKYCEHLPAGTNVLMIFPDSGYHYLSKIFNESWMQEKGFV